MARVRYDWQCNDEHQLVIVTIQFSTSAAPVRAGKGAKQAHGRQVMYPEISSILRQLLGSQNRADVGRMIGWLEADIVQMGQLNGTLESA